MMYKVFSSGIIQRNDGASFPPSAENGDYREYLEWCAAGNAPGHEPEPQYTEAEIKAELIKIAEKYLNDGVAARGYNNIYTAKSCINSTVLQWAAEGAAANIFYDAVWARTFEILDAGEPYPEPDAFVEMLPGMVWP